MGSLLSLASLRGGLAVLSSALILRGALPVLAPMPPASEVPQGIPLSLNHGYVHVQDKGI